MQEKSTQNQSNMYVGAFLTCMDVICIHLFRPGTINMHVQAYTTCMYVTYMWPHMIIPEPPPCKGNAHGTRVHVTRMDVT